MRTYDPAVRLLACEQCGASLPEAQASETLRCPFCDATHRLRMPEVVPSGEPVAPATRERNLLAQLDQPPTPSPIADLLDDGRLAPRREKEAVVAWVAIRKALAEAHDDAEAKRFYALTLALADGSWGDPLRQRAWLESGYEVAQLPRHRTVFCARLARAAAEADEIDAAEAWLSRGDAETQDIEAFSAASVARALVARGQGRAEAQRDAIVKAKGRLLLQRDDLALGALLRADGEARAGNLEAAIATLDRAADRGGPRLRGELHRLCEAHPELAAEPYRRFGEQRGRAQHSITYNTVVLVFFTLVWSGGGIFAITQLSAGKGMAWAVGAVIGLGAGIFLATMLAKLWRTREGWRQPAWATVVEVTPSSFHGVDQRSMATVRVALQSGEGDPVLVRGRDDDGLSVGDPVLIFPSAQGLVGYVLLR